MPLLVTGQALDSQLQGRGRPGALQHQGLSKGDPYSGQAPPGATGAQCRDWHVRMFINKKSHNNLLPLSHKGLGIKSSGLLR